MSSQSSKEQGNKGLFSLDGVMGDKLEDACRNHKPVRLILSRGANVSGYIKAFDRQFAQAVIETESGECVIRLGYLIQVFVKNNGETVLPPQTEEKTREGAIQYRQQREAEKEQRILTESQRKKETIKNDSL
jgi:hypothetical protein